MFSCCPTQLRNKLSTKKCSSGLWCSEKESSFLFLSLSWSVESTALRLITALGSSEVQPQFTRFLNDPKTVLSAESEELNRALILTLARATHVTGTHSVFEASFAGLFWVCLFFAARFILAIVSLFASLLIIVFDWNPSRFICHLLPVCADFFTGSDSIQGTWCKDILQTIMSFTPHNWASHTLSCFPAPLQVQILCYAKYSSNNCGLLLFFSVK